MELPEAYALKTVPGTDGEVVAFNFDFSLQPDEGKAIVGELDDGDLLIEGYAAEFDGDDREGENFADGAFERGIKAFLGGSAALCFHHQHKKVLGQVLDLAEHKGRGLWMKARVDGAIRKHPELSTYYEQIKKGSLKGLSVGGFFRRSLTPDGRKITDMDFTEISITGVPVHRKPQFAVVAGKALDMEEEVAKAEEPILVKEPDLSQFSESLDEIASMFSKLEGKAVKGDPQDLYFLALLLKLEQMTDALATKDETESGGPNDDRVDKLVGEVKDALDQYARQAHALAAKLGPLPTIRYS